MANYKVLATWDISIQNLYKDITLIQQGISCKLNISLRSISRVTVNYKVGNEYVTDLCTIDLDNNKVIVPFKKNVLEVGTHALELVCHMKNGDVLPTPNYSYTVTKSLTNDNDITEEDAYPVLIGMIQELTEKENVIQANEEARANAEMYRDMAEDERQNAEAQRKANENTRISNENTRKSNESSRQQYETQRRAEEDERLTDEQVRVNAENIRIANENERLRKEIERQNAEELRQIAYNSSLYGRMDEVEEQLAHKANINYLSFINVKEYGLKGDGITDDTQALITLLSLDVNKRLYFPKGEYIFSNTINIDCSKHSLIGENGTIFIFNVDNKTFLNISSSLNSLSSANTMENIKIVNQNKTCTAMFLGGNNDGRKCVGVSFRGIALEGFKNHIIFGDDAFIIQFERCTFLGWVGDSISYKSNPINSGENLSFSMCSWHDPISDTSRIFNITFGFFKFSRCSFDYFAQLGFVGDSSVPNVIIENSHIEYGFPHTVNQSSNTALIIDSGNVLISNTTLLWAKTIYNPFANCINGNLKFNNLTFRLLGLTLSEVEYLSEYSTNGGIVTYSNTIYDSIYEKQKIKLLNNTGILPNNIDFYTVGGGNVEIINDSEVGDCFSMTSTNSNTVYIATPFIPVNYLDEYLSFYKYKVVNINNGTFYPRFRLYDLNKKEVGVTQPFGAFTEKNNTDWTEIVSIFKKLSATIKPQIAFIQIRFEIFGHSGEGANVLVSIPYLDKI